MTPAVQALKKAKLNYQLLSYSHQPKQAQYGQEAVDKLQLNPAQVFKTLIICDAQQQHAVAVVPVSQQLDLKKAASGLGFKKCQMAAAKDVQRYTGYVLGGVSPLGQKRRLPTLIDSSAQQFEVIYCSAGKRGLELCLAPDDLRALCNGQFKQIGDNS